MNLYLKFFSSFDYMHVNIFPRVGVSYQIQNYKQLRMNHLFPVITHMCSYVQFYLDIFSLHVISITSWVNLPDLFRESGCEYNLLHTFDFLRIPFITLIRLFHLHDPLRSGSEWVFMCLVRFCFDENDLQHILHL